MANRNKSSGVTLVEMIAALVTLVLLAALVLPALDRFRPNPTHRLVSEGISIYNRREKQLWTSMILTRHRTDDVAAFDRAIFDRMDLHLDPGQLSGEASGEGVKGDRWRFAHQVFGDAATGRAYRGYIEFQGARAYVRRTPATFQAPALWRIHRYEP